MSEQKIKNQNQVTGVEFLTAAAIDFSIKSQEPLAPQAYATVIREFLQNNRQGTVGCKTRAEVQGSNKKPWKQKGTGRARAGARTSPLWRGGGIIFGPQARVRKLKVSKKLRRVVARELVKDAIDKKKLLAIDWSLQGAVPQTKQAFEMLKQKNLHTSFINVFVSITDGLAAASFANMPLVRLVFFDAPNVYALSDAQYWVVFKKDIDVFKDMISQWK